MQTGGTTRERIGTIGDSDAGVIGVEARLAQAVDCECVGTGLGPLSREEEGEAAGLRNVDRDRLRPVVVQLRLEGDASRKVVGVRLTGCMAHARARRGCTGRNEGWGELEP